MNVILVLESIKKECMDSFLCDVCPLLGNGECSVLINESCPEVWNMRDVKHILKEV